MEVGRVIGQRALADELAYAEGSQQAILGSERLVAGLGLVERRLVME